MFIKNYCQIHHLFYEGNECPLCRKERAERYSQKFKKEEKPVKKEKTEVTVSDLNKLVEKFNSKGNKR